MGANGASYACRFAPRCSSPLTPTHGYLGYQPCYRPGPRGRAVAWRLGSACPRATPAERAHDARRSQANGLSTSAGTIRSGSYADVDDHACVDVRCRGHRLRGRPPDRLQVAVRWYSAARAQGHRPKVFRIPRMGIGRAGVVGHWGLAQVRTQPMSAWLPGLAAAWPGGSVEDFAYPPLA
jgi:hypothetical protein